MSENNKHDENPDDTLYVPQPKRERRNSSLASIGSNILEEIIEGAVLQEADKVLQGAQFNQGNKEVQSTTTSMTTTSTSTTSTSTLSLTKASSSSSSMMKKREEDGNRM